MNYTYYKRRELNDAFRSYLLGQDIREDKEGGVPMLCIENLPEQARAVESVSELVKLLPPNDRAWRKVVPVFVKAARMPREGMKMEYYYLLNYVNCSNESMEMAAELVASARLFWIPELTIETNGKRNN